jgi:hypothetical protein
MTSKDLTVGMSVMVSADFLKTNPHFTGECKVTFKFSFGFEIESGGKFTNVTFRDVRQYPSHEYSVESIRDFFYADDFGLHEL